MKVGADIVHQALLASEACFQGDVCKRSPCACAEKIAKYINEWLAIKVGIEPGDGQSRL